MDPLKNPENRTGRGVCSGAGSITKSPVRARRVQLLRSKSLPAPDLERRLPLARNDSNRSDSTVRDSGCKDSGFASDDHGADKAQQNGTPTIADLLKRDDPKISTIRQHYYPEGGWGWVIVSCAFFIQMICHGLQMAYGVLFVEILRKYGRDRYLETAWLGTLSSSLSLLLSPIVIALCRRKSTRLTAVLGGLVTALGCLFTSFASQFHQLFFSYGVVMGIGVSLVRDTSNIMVGQYFKRKRETVEIITVGSSGIGIGMTSILFRETIRAIGWRLGLQAVTGVVFLSFFLGVCYRSASLYHPQRRAILHLKNQKRKIKDKAKVDDKPPFFDFGTLKSRTVQILLFSSGIAALGINTPVIFMVYQAEEEGLSAGVQLLLQVFLGLAFAGGCGIFGLLIVKSSADCRIARQYLCQAAAFMSGICILAFTAVQGAKGYVIFVWIYGAFCGGYHYSLKMYTFEKVRARNFTRAWGFVQWAQAIPLALGAPITGYINVGFGGKTGFFFASACLIVSSLALFLVDVHKRNVAKRRSLMSSDHRRCSSSSCSRVAGVSVGGDGRGSAGNVLNRSSSLPDLDDFHGPPFSLLQQKGVSFGTLIDLRRAELTCISEEGIADLPDNILEDLDYVADCMTSCDQVEHYLMLSEYENNLIKTKEMEAFIERNKRRRSLGRLQSVQTDNNAEFTTDQRLHPRRHQPSNPLPREMPTFRTTAWRLLHKPTRSITVIDEITTTL